MRNKVQHFTFRRITFFFRLNFKCWPMFINLWKYVDYTNNFNVSMQSVCGLKQNYKQVKIGLLNINGIVVKC